MNPETQHWRPRLASVPSLPDGAVLAVGFGAVFVLCNGECVWYGDDPSFSLSPYSALAKQEPDSDWQVRYHGPLNESVYQYQGNGWYCIKTGEGFA